MLGLLGTVLGMTQVFQVMAIQGVADPRALSTGISHAPLTTLAGLVIALPGLYFVQLIEHRADRLTERLAHKLSP
jgi:biopolymer transport protein ExbB